MKAIVWERTPKEVLDAFDTRTKICHMNCGPSAGDPRSAKERKFQCPDCWNACAVCGAGMQEGETDCPVCTGAVSTPDQDFVRGIPDIQPLGWISEHTRQWLKDPNSHGPGMFTVNRNGQGGMWALYAGSDFQRLHQHAEKLREIIGSNELLIQDLASLVRRMSYAIAHSDNKNPLIRKSIELLKKHNLGGSVLREMNK